MSTTDCVTAVLNAWSRRHNTIHPFDASCESLRTLTFHKITLRARTAFFLDSQNHRSSPAEAVFNDKKVLRDVD